MTAESWAVVREILYKAGGMNGEERAEFLRSSCRGDAELRQELDRLLSALDESDTFLEPPADGAAMLSGGRIGPYLILDLAGHGGMGTVYRAIRENDYRQQVALKLVRREVETMDLQARFRQERQVLAMLNHANIARLLDGGTTADGRPYLVMEWVDGTPITEHCREHKLPLRQRLELFLTVCHAVSHAHGSLVVHRDLKPSNILIPADGPPKLLDFGIAKILTSESDDTGATWTLAGFRPLTPDYASPEQVRGEPASTANDIYSLGAVLFEMLTGARPHRFENRTRTEVERVICDGAVRRPSEAAQDPLIGGRELRGDLDNIVLKALEKDRARRYSHVEELAFDLRRHLEGHPVLARPGSLRYRVAKFTARNKLLVGATLAVVAALAVGLALTLWQARVAQQQRQLAEHRFDLARRVADSLLYEINDEIQDLSGSSKARELLLRRSLEYLDALSKEAASNTMLQRDVANAYERAAELQGVAGMSNLGEPAAARESLRKAQGLLERALAADPASVEIRRDLSRTHRQFVSVSDDPTAMIEHARSSLGLMEQLRRERSTDTAVLDDLQKSECSLGRALTASSRYSEAIVLYRRALSHSGVSAPENVALVHKVLGAVLIKTQASDEALKEYQAAAALDEERVRSNPANGRAKLDLSFDYSDWGFIELQLKHMAAAVELYRKAERLRGEMAAADPRDARAGGALVSVEWRLGEALARAGDRAGAEDAFRKSVGAGQRMIAVLPEMKSGKQALAEAYLSIGLTYRRQWASCAQALPWLVRARGLFRELNQPGADQAIAECQSRAPQR